MASKSVEEQELPIKLTSPISIKKIVSFGLMFIVIQVGGTLITRFLGSSGMMITGFFGGLISSASTTAAAATMAMHGQISANVAGNTAIISSMASAMVDFPIVWKNIHDRKLVKAFTWKLASVLAAGGLALMVDRVFHLSDYLIAVLGK